MIYTLILKEIFWRIDWKWFLNEKIFEEWLYNIGVNSNASWVDPSLESTWLYWESILEYGLVIVSLTILGPLSQLISNILRLMTFVFYPLHLSALPLVPFDFLSLSKALFHCSLLKPHPTLLCHIPFWSRQLGLHIHGSYEENCLFLMATSSFLAFLELI